jgi:aspartyl-tRNA(Asn)/glutamyl-tRNA(Gln) amidotransferase subunit A
LRRSSSRGKSGGEIDTSRDAPSSATIASLSRALKNGETSSAEVLAEVVRSVGEAGHLNAFLTITAETGFAQARAADRLRKQGLAAGPLHGIPIALKDNVLTRGIRTTMGSALYRDFTPEHSASIVGLLDRAGAVLIGKTHLHEFALGATGDRSFAGPARNPHDPTRITGGSSSGSAAAVAAGLVPGAIGTDTGGSIRIPSSLCGAVGMKPTFGRVSKAGVFPLSFSMDHVGPITRTVEDNALLLGVLARFDTSDPCSVERPPEDFTRSLRDGVRGGRIGIPTSWYFDDLEPEVEEAVLQAASILANLGATVVPVHLENLSTAFRAQRVILSADAYAGHKTSIAKFPDKYDPETRARMMAGSAIEPSVYAEAQSLRDGIRRMFDQTFGIVDVILTPTTAITASQLGAREIQHAGLTLDVGTCLTRCTAPTNLTGHPSLSVPCGRSTEGLPIGLQLIGRRFDEQSLYRFAYAFERVLQTD